MNEIIASDWREANDRSERLATRYLFEAGAVVHGFCAEPHRIVARDARLVDRVSLEQFRAVLPRVDNGPAQKGVRDALTAILRPHDEADDRPHRLVVDGLHNRRSLQPGVLLAGPQRYPADGDLAAIGEKAGYPARVDQRLQVGAIRLRMRRPSRQWSTRTAAAVVHAPAAAGNRATFRIEDRLEVGPAPGRQGQDGVLHHRPTSMLSRSDGAVRQFAAATRWPVTPPFA